MVIEVKKRKTETISNLIRRFTRSVQQSGILIQARQRRFYRKPKNKRKKRESALRRQEILRLREELTKQGLLREGEMIPKDKIKKLDELKEKN